MTLVSSDQIYWADDENITISSTAIGFTGNRRLPINGTLVDNGTTDSDKASSLVDSTQNFLTTIRKGFIVANMTDNTQAKVTNVVSDTELTLDNDIMDSGEVYKIYLKSDLAGMPASFANVKVTGSYNIRWKMTGTSPTATNGTQQFPTDEFTIEGSTNVANFKAIRESSDSSIYVKYGWGMKL